MIVSVNGGYKIKSHKTGKLYPKVYLSKEAAQRRINQMEQFKYMKKSLDTLFVIKADVSPYSRVKRGKFERVGGYSALRNATIHQTAKDYLVSKKDAKNIVQNQMIGETYPATDKGFYDAVQTHLGLDRYDKIIKENSKTTQGIQGVNNAYLQVVKELSAGGFRKEGLNLKSFMLKDGNGLKNFLGKVFEQVQDDVRNTRMELGKSKKSRKNRCVR